MAPRLAGIVRLVLAAPQAPAVVVAALVHAEIAVVRPFVRGNAVVARAMERLVIQASGLDPTGVAVPEVGHGRESGAAYLGALAAYASGTPQGVALWLTHCGEAIVAGAQEGPASPTRSGPAGWAERRPGFRRVGLRRADVLTVPPTMSGKSRLPFGSGREYTWSKPTGVSPTTTVRHTGDPRAGSPLVDRSWWACPTASIENSRLVPRTSHGQDGTSFAGCHPSVGGAVRPLRVFTGVRFAIGRPVG